MAVQGQVSFQWRRFMFFDQERVDNQTDSIVSQLKNFHLFGVFGGRGTLILATQPGFLHFVSRQFTDLALQPAFQSSILSLTGLRKHSYIMAVGKDEPNSLPVLKIWNYDKIEVGINPTLTRTLKLELPDFSCLVSHENLNYMAIGFKCGKVYLYHKDIARGRHSNQRILCDLREEITGLVFSPQARDVFLYISTPNSLHGYCIVSANNAKERKVFSDSVGCLPGQLCAVQLTNPDQHVGIVCPDGVRFYGPDGMGSTCSTTLDNIKFLISWQLDYLFVATREASNDNASKQQTIGATRKEERQSQNVLTVYDSVNKFISFTGSFRNLTFIVAEFGAVYVFTADGMLFRLVEKDLQSKLDLLFKKNQYEIAIKLAKSQRYGDSGLIKIYKHYGDHLFSKGDFLSAAEQYRQTIGGLETSYVIRQLLTGAAPPAALGCYLEGVHEKRKATAHHTSLLLNCYIKMKDETKLEAFILKNENEVTFDADVAVRVLRQANYKDLALRLAEANHNHQQVVSIYVEDLGKDRMDNALSYVEGLDPASANWCIRRFGQQFMAYSPERTTNLLKTLLSLKAHEQVPRPSTGSIQADATSVPSLQLFSGRPGPLMSFLESIVERSPDSSPAVYITLLEVYVQQWNSHVAANDAVKQKKYEDKILDLLRSRPIEDKDQSLLLMFSSYKFFPGVEFLLEKSGNYTQLMSHLADRGNFQKMASLCERHCGVDEDQGMRLRLLSLLASSRDGVELIPRIVTGFIAGEAATPSENVPPSKSAGHGRVLAPEVIDSLSRSESCDVPFHFVRDYLLSELHQVDTEADKNAAISDQTRGEAVDLRQKLENIRNNALSFQETRCRSCNFKLELPTVHFLCQHSYHSNCLDYGDPDICPKCSKEQKEILEQYRAFDDMRRAPSANIHELAEVPDLFATLGDLLAKGLLSGGAASVAGSNVGGSSRVSQLQ